MKKDYSRFIKMLCVLSAACFLASCQSGETDVQQEETQSQSVLTETDINTVENTPVSENTSVEEKLTFVSGTSFAGMRRPYVVTDQQYLPETPVDGGQTGKIVYSVNDEDAGEIAGVKVQNADGSTTVVEAIPELGYKFVKWSDGETDAKRSGDSVEGVYTAIFDYDVLDMPIIVINTDDGEQITSKTDYKNATMSLLGCSENFQLNEVNLEIRGRGNNSWSYPKKSYKFKLETKENLFDMANGKERVWVLLANQCDQSLQRNHVAFELGRYFEGIAWEPASTSVEVYLNGEYVGVYLLAEDIKISNDRVDITDTNVDEIDTGYLLELSNYATGEVIDAANRNYMVHNDLSADSDIKRQQKRYIQGYVNDCYEILSTGTMEECAELIDIDSLVAVYLVEEITKNLDSQWDSFYLHKDAGGKLVFGPIWDFDLSLGNADEGAEEYTDIFVGNGQGSGGGFNTWFAVASTRDWFRQLVVDKWVEIYDSISLIPQHIIDEAELGLRSYNRNFEKWTIFGTKQNRETRYITRLQNYEEHYTYLAEWATNRIEWLNEAFMNDTFVTEGTGIVMMQWLNQNGGWGGGGNQNSRYGNDATEKIASTYDSLALYIRQNTVTGPDGFPGEGAKNLFDDNKDTKYCLVVDGEATVTVNLGRAKALEAYMFRTGNDTQENPERNPNAWTIYGSNDNENWEVIHEVTDGEEQLEPKNHIWYGFEIENPKEYKYYKIVFKENGTMQLSEIRFLGEE